jgi:hypothetical protein
LYRLPGYASAGSQSACSGWYWSSRQDAKLSHQGHVVANSPSLDGLPVLEAQNLNVVHSDLPIRGRDAHQVTSVPTVKCAIDDNGFALANDLVDFPTLVAEYPSEPPHRLLGSDKTLRLVWAGGVIDPVFRDYLRETVDVATWKNLLPDSACLCLEFPGHDDSFATIE